MIENPYAIAFPKWMELSHRSFKLDHSDASGDVYVEEHRPPSLSIGVTE